MSERMTANTGAETGAGAAAKPGLDLAGLDQALGALQKYDLGSGRSSLLPVDDAVAAARSDEAVRARLEGRLAELLGASLSRAAKEYVCRQLAVIGSARSVPVLSACLADPGLAHLARNALEVVPGPEAGQALRESLRKVTGLTKVGVVNSLGRRRDAESVPVLGGLLEDGDVQVAGAAAAALGEIGNVESARALAKFQAAAPEALRLVAADACLVCAERLLREGTKGEALQLFKQLNHPAQAKQVRLAAMRGQLAAAAKD